MQQLDTELIDEALAPGGRIIQLWAANVKAAREGFLGYGLKTEELAVICRVHPTTILRVELGKQKPSLALMMKISAALCTRPEKLFPFPANDTLASSYLAA